MVAPEGDAEVRANIYARIGEVKRGQGKPREAELNYEKALGAAPKHRPSLDALVDLAIAAKEPRRAIEWRRKRLATLEGADERVAELVAIARTQGEELKDARAAAEALEEALVVDRRDRTVLECAAGGVREAAAVAAGRRGAVGDGRPRGRRDRASYSSASLRPTSRLAGFGTRSVGSAFSTARWTTTRRTTGRSTP